jgi:uncharacterized protein YecA (UPF0149 family)
MQELKRPSSVEGVEGDSFMLQFFEAAGRDKARRIAQAMDKSVPEGCEVVRRIRVGRNDSCPCGSGKKYKKCCIYKAKKV